jgi:hypothetical protein
MAHYACRALLEYAETSFPGDNDEARKRRRIHRRPDAPYHISYLAQKHDITFEQARDLMLKSVSIATISTRPRRSYSASRAIRTRPRLAAL